MQEVIDVLVNDIKLQFCRVKVKYCLILSNAKFLLKERKLFLNFIYNFYPLVLKEGGMYSLAIGQNIDATNIAKLRSFYQKLIGIQFNIWGKNGQGDDTFLPTA